MHLDTNTNARYADEIVKFSAQTAGGDQYRYLQQVQASLTSTQLDDLLGDLLVVRIMAFVGLLFRAFATYDLNLSTCVGLAAYLLTIKHVGQVIPLALSTALPIPLVVSSLVALVSGLVAFEIWLLLAVPRPLGWSVVRTLVVGNSALAMSQIAGAMLLNSLGFIAGA